MTKPSVLPYLAELALLSGEVARALELTQEALDLAGLTAVQDYEPRVRFLHGMSLILAGRASEAVEPFAAALTCRDGTGRGRDDRARVTVCRASPPAGETARRPPVWRQSRAEMPKPAAPRCCSAS